MNPVYYPQVPYVAPIGGNLLTGRMVRIQGSVPHHTDRFDLNLMCGPSNADIPFHMSVRFRELQVVRNSLIANKWGVEERSGMMPFNRGYGFEILILCEPAHYKIAVDGKHFAKFVHRLPYERVTYLGVSGNVSLNLIQWEGNAPGFVTPSVPAPPPPPYYPYPPQHHTYHPPPPPPPATYPHGYPHPNQTSTMSQEEKDALMVGVPVALGVAVAAAAGIGALAASNKGHRRK